jgi:hypothetical protein
MSELGHPNNLQHKTSMSNKNCKVLEMEYEKSANGKCT